MVKLKIQCAGCSNAQDGRKSPMNQQDILKQKEAIRQAARKRRSLLSPESRAEFSMAAADLFESVLDEKTCCLMVYLSFDDEMDTAELVSRAHESGLRIAVPVIKRSSGLMEACEYTPGMPCMINSYGISEPRADFQRIIQATEIDAIAVPLIAFDNQCNRIGFGKGYYDRFLASGTFQTIGMAFETQRVPAIECAPWDVRLDCVITEKKITGA